MAPFSQAEFNRQFELIVQWWENIFGSEVVAYIGQFLEGKTIYMEMMEALIE